MLDGLCHFLQKPGGLTLWLTLVHFGSSASPHQSANIRLLFGTCLIHPPLPGLLPQISPPDFPPPKPPQFLRPEFFPRPPRIKTENQIAKMLVNLLCTPFRYFFSLRSKIVYLSLGNISHSAGISSFQRSTALDVSPCFASAASTVAMTASTARRRLRWRAFWGCESRQGIFLIGD